MKKYDELKVFCKNTGEYLSMDGGEALSSMEAFCRSRLPHDHHLGPLSPQMYQASVLHILFSKYMVSFSS